MARELTECTTRSAARAACPAPMHQPMTLGRTYGRLTGGCRLRLRLVGRAGLEPATNRL